MNGKGFIINVLFSDAILFFSLSVFLLCISFSLSGDYVLKLSFKKLDPIHVSFI